MVLSRGYISKHARTKTALVRDNEIIDHVTYVMPWQLGHHLMMDKSCMASCDVLTWFAFNSDVTRKPTMRLIIGTLCAKTVFQMVQLNAAEVFEIHIEKQWFVFIKHKVTSSVS